MSIPGRHADPGAGGGADPRGGDDELDEAAWSAGGTDDAVVAALEPAVPGAAGVGEGAATVRVVRGDPDDVELAALVAGIVAARGADAGEVHDEGGDGPAPWSDRARPLRLPPTAGPDAWRWSLHP